MEPPLTHTQEFLNDLANTSCLKNIFNFIPHVFYSIKNLMPNRSATQKKFSNLFVEYWTPVIPEIITNWNDFSKKA